MGAEGAWIEHVRGWLRGEPVLFAHLERTTKWRQEERKMYDRMVLTPRLYGVVGNPSHATRFDVNASSTTSIPLASRPATSSR